MAAPAPPLATPSGNSRARDWPRTELGSSAFGGNPRGGRGGGGGRGRSRGGRGRGPNPNSNSTGHSKDNGGAEPSHASKNDKSTNNESLPPKATPASTTSTPDPKPKPSPNPSISALSNTTTPSSGSRRHGRKPSRSTPLVVPAVLVGGPSPSTVLPATAPVPRPSNRRRRSQQSAKGGNGAISTGGSNLKVNVPASDDSTLLRPQNRLLAPRSAPPPSKDTPPHLAGSFRQNDIDAFVERVRASAMESNRPNTPGSHIDWAGDDDESLPDLDDWGVKTVTQEEKPVEPEPKDSVQAQKDMMISPIIVDGLTALPDPVAPPADVKEEAVVPFSADEQPRMESTPPPTSLQPAAEKSSEPAVQPAPLSGLAASIYAPSNSDDPAETFHPTHQRAHTVGRTFSRSAHNLNQRDTRGTRTPGNQHARTHSSPPASVRNPRPPHARPVITGAAISRLARTIAAPSKTP
ncbi:unnamed protein product [Mycena citricolor]|uniref:Uncharacterized protein n=1 Tax=Mycena citricolor TaxID=2018698 RepID=A0AAD2GSA9_9AGAR|nr:unnamed protein product [Mycena citricolor]CAK5276012.1 unnamed protein product [Mycena citricolor]